MDAEAVVTVHFGDLGLENQITPPFLARPEIYQDVPAGTGPHRDRRLSRLAREGHERHLPVGLGALAQDIRVPCRDSVHLCYPGRELPVARI